MTHTKPILALSSIGLGAALVLTAIHIQRDRFAFTSQESRNFDAPTSVTLVAPIPPPAKVQPSVPAEEIPTVEIEALRVLPDKPATPRSRKPAAATETVEPAQPPCRPQWRGLESGPAGRNVREICEPVLPADVPRS